MTLREIDLMSDEAREMGDRAKMNAADEGLKRLCGVVDDTASEVDRIQAKHRGEAL
jgi:hypothetical protein